MGAKDRNFHKDVFARLGYEAECEKIQEAYLAGRKDEAASYVPTSMVEDVYLIGPEGQGPRRPRGVARDLRHHDARERPARSCSRRSPSSSRADSRT